MFVYQSTFSTLDIKRNQKEHIILKPSLNLTSIIKYFEDKMGLVFNNSVLAVEQNNLHHLLFR